MLNFLICLLAFPMLGPNLRAISATTEEKKSHQVVHRRAVQQLLPRVGHRWWLEAPVCSVRAANVGCSRSGAASSRTDSRSPCMGSRPLANPAVDARATVSSSHQVGRRFG